jgi:heat shock protein HslJ
MKLMLLALALGAAQPEEWPKGDAIAPNQPEVTSWHFVEIDGKSTHLTGDLLQDDIYSIDFYPGGFVGYGGCDRFDGTFTRKGDLLTTKPHGRTESRCDRLTAELQHRLFEILFGNPVRVSFPDGETMLLTGTNGVVRLKRTRE